MSIKNLRTRAIPELKIGDKYTTSIPLQEALI